MKMQKLVQAAPALRKLTGKDMPVKIAYGLYGMVKKVDDHLTFYDQKNHENLEMYYSEKEKGKWYPKSEEDKQKYDKAQEELLDLEVDLKDLKPVTIRLTDDIFLAASDLILLEGFIEVETEE